MNNDDLKFSAREAIVPSLARFEKMLPEILAESQEAPADLLPKIILAISRRRRLYARLEMAGSLVMSGISLAVLFFAIGELGRQLEQAGTLKIISLVFSDSMAILANWQEFTLSFLESLPVWPAALTLAGFLMLLVAAKFAFDSLPKLSFNLSLKINN